MNGIIIFLIIVGIAVAVLYFLYRYFSKSTQEQPNKCKQIVFKDNIKDNIEGDSGIINRITKEENLL